MDNNKTFQADILVVDDKLENIRFLSDFLSQHNYQVRKAISGKAALMAAQAVSPDLILLDINMPGMGGYELCEKLKQDPQTSSVPVIFISAGSEVTDKIKGFEVGGVDYITKPFYLEEVLVRIKTQLEIKSLQKELESRNQKLEETLSLLKSTQAELVQKEKLVNAGRIAAGISHEINNPLSFIICNLTPASEYTQKLIKTIQIYQQEYPNTNPNINEFIDESELKFITSDLDKIIKSMHNGAERISSVIQALHVFSRLDHAGIKYFDVHETIDSTLTTLCYQLKLPNNITIAVIKKYDEIPEIQGYAKIFNQALANIIQNAIDALSLKLNNTNDDSFQPTIWIYTTTVNGEKVRVSIQDNGAGIPDENKEYIFDPFFTTKNLQEGTGLGLFTSHQIITDIHKGSLIYQKRPEGGSEFLIEVPISRHIQ